MSASAGRGRRRCNGSLRRRPAILLAVWVIAGVYLFPRIDTDWIPHDEGTQAQAAERVLAGELPHVDFNDPYTGGLAFFHAGVFRVLGVRLYSLRLAFFLSAMLFVPALFAIAARVATPWAAGALTLLGLAWSVPNYMSGVPSWYNLFFATFGILALQKAGETEKWPWYAAAGLAGGASLLVKSVGAYYVVAALLTLVYRSQVLAGPAERSRRPGLLGLALVGALLTLGALPLALVWKRATAMNLLHFAFPGLLLVGFLIGNERHLLYVEQRRRRLLLRRSLGPFLGGLIVPVAVFLLPFAAASGLDDLFRGVFVHPGVRLRLSQAPLPPPASLLAALPLAALSFGALSRRKTAWERALGVPCLLIAGTLVFLGVHPVVYTGVWKALRPSVPLATLLGCIVLAGAARRGMSGADRTTLFLLVSGMAWTSLVQFPHPLGVYFCYVAPLVIVAMAATIRWLPSPRYLLWGILLGGLFGFAVRWLHTASTYELGYRHVPLQLASLALPRGGLRVPAQEAAQYQWLVREIQQRSRDGDYIYAAPDAPEVYFLAARRNPTRTFGDVFDPDFFEDPDGRTERILAALERHQVRVVALKRRTEFTGRLPEDLRRSLEERYPREACSPLFCVRWREG